ncbi:lecithin retinol acyltransferase family protein [bacterium]|nr:lecithin retinol acyltransferase family protein [bacterium]
MIKFGPGFGKSNNPLEDLTRTIIQKPPFSKKTRKKACDFIHTVSDSELRKGDVIGVHRIGGIYDHYGIYTGRGKVIHFSNEGSDFGGDIRVRRATLSQFKDGASNVFVIDFEAYRDYIENPGLLELLEEGIVGIALRKLFGSEKITIYSPEETVKRAESQLGEGNYNLVFNNCEHFAVWCKTGVHESSQVQRFLEAIAERRATNI